MTHIQPMQRSDTGSNKLFWRCLNTLGVWQDEEYEEYLRAKELRTARDDRRDIMPRCVIEVRKKYLWQ